MTTLIDFAAMRPEYSRMERFHELAQLYLEIGRPERALKPLEKYLRWNPEDAVAREEQARAIQEAARMKA